MTIGKLSGQCDFGQKGQSYCNQRGQSCVAKRVKVAWLFHFHINVVLGLMLCRFQPLTDKIGVLVHKVYDALVVFCVLVA